MCYLDAEARLLVVLDDGAHEGAVPLEVLEHHLAEHLAVGARAWAGANHARAPRCAALRASLQSPKFGDNLRGVYETQMLSPVSCVPPSTAMYRQARLGNQRNNSPAEREVLLSRSAPVPFPIQRPRPDD